MMLRTGGALRRCIRSSTCPHLPIQSLRAISTSPALHPVQRRSNIMMPWRRTVTTQRTTIDTALACCPSCSAALSPSASSRNATALCPSCSSLLPPPPLASTTHFSLFSLPPAYSLDQRALKNDFLRWQQRVHPDLFSNQGERLEWSREWSRRVNDAFRCLEGDRTRGEYLLSLHGVMIGEADSVTEPELLMSIMETREALEEAETEEEVAAIRSSNRAEIKNTVDALAKAFDETTPPDLQLAKNLVIQLRYLDNVDLVCRDWTANERRVDVQH